MCSCSSPAPPAALLGGLAAAHTYARRSPNPPSQTLKSEHTRLKGFKIVSQFLVSTHPAMWVQVSAEALLNRIAFEPGFAASQGPWLASLPAMGSLLVPRTMDDAELDMLQGGPLVSLVWNGINASHHMRQV